MIEAYGTVLVEVIAQHHRQSGLVQLQSYYSSLDAQGSRILYYDST